MKRVHATAAAVFVLGAVTFLSLEHQALTRLRNENATLSEQAGDLPRTREEYERLAAALADWETAAVRPEDQLSELQRLRDESTRLRNDLARIQQPAQEPQKNLAGPILPRASDPSLTRAERFAEMLTSFDLTTNDVAALQAGISREHCVIAGHDTPAAALQSLYAARLSGDRSGVVDCFTPEARSRVSNDHPPGTAGPGALSNASGFRVHSSSYISRADELQVAFRVVIDSEPPLFNLVVLDKTAAGWRVDRLIESGSLTELSREEALNELAQRFHLTREQLALIR